MHLDAFPWLFFPAFMLGVGYLLSYIIMQAKMEVALSKERESLAEARATITTQKLTMEERLKATEESTKRIAMDEFMQDFRVEERSYVRESKSLSASKKSMVMQERLFFRNIPLSNWIEREMLVEEGFDLDKLPIESVFAPASLGAAEGRQPISITEGRLPISKTMPDLAVVRPPARPPTQEVSLVPAHVAAFFGAQ
jgi:hypothetical protein